MKIFFGSSLYSFYLLLIFSAYVRSIAFLSFIEPIFEWNVPLVSLIFLKRTLVFPILLFSSVVVVVVVLHWSYRKGFLSLLAILWNSAFKWVYLCFSPLPFTSLLFTATCKASSDSHFAFCIFFSWGWSWSLTLGSVPKVRKIPWRRAWQPTLVFLAEESYGQRNVLGYSPCSHTPLSAQSFLNS